MKYTDSQRLEKIRDYCDKLLTYLDTAGITRQMLLEDYTVQWTVTTPLYNLVLKFIKSVQSNDTERYPVVQRLQTSQRTY